MTAGAGFPHVPEVLFDKRLWPTTSGAADERTVRRFRVAPRTDMEWPPESGHPSAIRLTPALDP